MLGLVKTALDRAAADGEVRREPHVAMRVPSDVPGRPERQGKETYAPTNRRPRADAILAELSKALPAPAPSPLSEEARKLVSEQDINRAKTVRDSLRAVAAGRLAEFDARVEERREAMADEAAEFDATVQAWVKARKEELAAETASFESWVSTRRAELVEFSDRIYAWGDDRVERVTAEMESRAREHHRDVDIVYSTQALLEKHGVPLPPPKPAVVSETHDAADEPSTERPASASEEADAKPNAD